jgi:hypothetical protein
MAEKLEITIEAYRSAMAATQATHTESIDDVYSDHSDWFADNTPDAYDQLESKSMHKAISAAVGTLPEREAMVLQLYFVEELNLEEIGQVLGVGAARVCQIKKTALGKLRGKLTGWDAASWAESTVGGLPAAVVLALGQGSICWGSRHVRCSAPAPFGAVSSGQSRKRGCQGADVGRRLRDP